jgi:DNA-binding FrmR family transcriptional regulator
MSVNPPPGGTGYSEDIEGNLSEAKFDALKRLSYIEGHLTGIRKMLEEDKYCVDVLKQTYAVRRAIEKMESILLEGHLHSCVVDGIKEGREDEVVGELTDLYLLANR